MFCPLCQAEYREGFAQCSDCHIDLIDSFQDAQSAPALLWKGNKQGMLDKVLAALDNVDVRSHFKEISEPMPEDTLGVQKLVPLYVRLLVRASREFRLHYEVWVLKEDLEKARSAIADLL
jgi:hypothetical protein